MYGPARPVVCLSIPSAREDLAGWSPLPFPVPVNPAPRCFCLRVWGAVRACTWLSAGSAVEEPARTYIWGQRRRDKHHSAAFMQVRGYVEVQAGGGCKTVGSAYVGSNPTPATRFRSSEPVTLDLRHRLLRAKGAVQQTVGCGLWAMPGPDPAVCSRRTRSHMMPSQLRKQSAEGLGQPRFWPAGRVFVGRGGAAGEEPRTHSGRGHGRCRRFGTPLAVTHAGVSRAGRCDRVYTRSTSAVHAGSMPGR